MLTQKSKIIKHKHKFIYFILSLIVIFIIICFALNPKTYMQETLTGLEVFIKNVFPSLFPFFILTKILSGLNCIEDFSHLFGSTTRRLFNTSGISAYAFFIAIISGYPVGAKVVYDLYSSQQLSEDEVSRVVSFTSTSGPLFIIGTVGVGMLNSFKCGCIMLICHIIASIINGLIYRKYRLNNKPIAVKYKSNFTVPDVNKVISDSIYNSVVSIAIVGAYIVIFYMLISLINNLNIFTPVCFLLNKVGIDINITNACLNGVVEITRGCLDISKLSCSLSLKTILCGSIISFGGLSVAFQGFNFLKHCNVKFSFFIKQKITHCLISVILLIPLSFLI